jgi:hypothetical protein
MGKHSRPGPSNQPSRAVPRVDADNPFAAYDKRRRPPMDIYRRHRLDWKYLLGLELADPGFDHSVLTEFRDRLIAGDAGMQLLDRVLEAAVQHDLLKAGGRARTDSMIVLAATRQVNGLVRLGETLRAALNSVEGTVCAPGRCRRHDLPGRPSLRPAGCRYSGLAKARLQHQLTATAMNFHRLNAWWTGIPRAGTRTSHLAALRP